MQDKFSNHTATGTLLIITSASIVLVEIYVLVNSFSLFFAGFMCFMWGLADGSMNTFVNCILGFQFDSKTTPFSVCKTI